LSFAFNTIILFLIIFSGLASRRAYFSKEFSKNYIKKNTFDELVGGIFFGVVLQILGILILKTQGISFDFKTLGFLLVGAKDDTNVANSFSCIENNIGRIFVYNISLISIAFLLGYFLRIIVRKFKLDRKWRFFRFDNEWHYNLSGEILEFPSAKISGTDVDAKKFGNKYVNVLTKVDDHFIIYSGILVESFLSNEGGLDLLCLKGVKKKVIKKEQEKPVTIEHPMTIDAFVIPYSQILNLSITYYIFKLVEPRQSKPNFFKKIWFQAKAWAEKIQSSESME
jgi:hypothetical protein